MVRAIFKIVISFSYLVISYTVNFNAFIVVLISS